MGYFKIFSKVINFCSKNSKPKNQIINKTRYITKQGADIKLFGQKNVERFGVTDEILENVTPFRRTSNKPASLSDPEYFISKFEKETGNNFLPEKWNRMNEVEKIDYIVHKRYTGLVSNKIMDQIKHKDIEHLYSLDKDGEIIGYAVGETGHVVQNGELSKVKTTVHNHPQNLWTDDAEFKAAGKPKIRDAHSCGDVGNAMCLNIDSYVVDWQGNKFLFEPAQKFPNEKWTRSQIGTKANLEVDFAGESSSIVSEINQKLKTAKNIKEFANFKFKKMKGVLDRQINAIKEMETRGWCKFSEKLS